MRSKANWDQKQRIVARWTRLPGIWCLRRRAFEWPASPTTIEIIELPNEEKESTPTRLGDSLGNDSRHEISFAALPTGSVRIAGLVSRSTRD